MRVLLASAAMAGIALCFALLATPQYRSEARLLIEAGSPPLGGAGSAAGRGLAGDDGVAGQVELILSTDLLSQVALKLGLARLPEFDAADETSRLARMLVAAGLSSDPGEISPRERVLNAFRHRLSVHRVKGSRMIAIGSSSADPGLAADIPNALADAYLAMQSTARELSHAAAWLEPEIASLSKEVEVADARLAAFRTRVGEVVARSEAASAARSMAEISGELTKVRATRAEAETRAQGIAAALQGGLLDDLPEMPSSAELKRLVETAARLGAEFAGLPLTSSGEHPGSAALRSRLDVLGQHVRTEAETAMKGLIGEAAGAQAREQQLLADLDRLKAEAARAGEMEIELRALEREANARRELLDSYLARYREASARRDFPPVDARIVQRAVAPSEAYFPRILPIAAAAFAASLLAMGLLAFVGDVLRSRARRQGTRARPEPIDEVTVPETVPFALERAPRLPAPVDVPMPPAHAVSEAAECLGEIGIEAAAERLVAGGVTRAIFISPEGDAAAVAAVLVAREVADAGLRVLLLDLTASGAASRPMLQSVSLPGITDLLASQAQFTDSIHQDRHSDCHVIPVGTAEPERAMRSADRLPIIMDSLTAAYDMVVVECGPTDPESISRLVRGRTEVLVSLMEAEVEAAAMAARLRDAGHGGPMLVTPAGYRTPVSRMRDRTAA